MPAPNPNGQPDPIRDWFASTAGRALLESELALIRQALSDRPAPPWLWLAPGAQDREDCGRGICLAANGTGWEGDVRCSVPLPFASGSLGTVVLQHVHADPGRAEALLAECARVLVEGGRLYLLVLNPLSPYRVRWRGVPMRASEPLTWRRRLRQAGLEADPVSQGVGPGWKTEAREGLRNGPGMRAAYALRAEKRAIPLTPVPMKQRARLGLPQGLPAA